MTKISRRRKTRPQAAHPGRGRGARATVNWTLRRRRSTAARPRAQRTRPALTCDPAAGRVSARVEPAREKRTQLRTRIRRDSVGVGGPHADAAKERLDVADHSISRARELVAQTSHRSAERTGRLCAGHEAALQQASSMLDSVDSAASDIRHAVATLPSVIADTQQGINEAVASSPRVDCQTPPELNHGARRCGHRGDRSADKRAADPLGALPLDSRPTPNLDRLLAEVAEERETAERLSRSLEKALFTRNRVG